MSVSASAARTWDFLSWFVWDEFGYWFIILGVMELAYLRWWRNAGWALSSGAAATFVLGSWVGVSGVLWTLSNSPSLVLPPWLIRVTVLSPSLLVLVAVTVFVHAVAVRRRSET